MKAEISILSVAGILTACIPGTGKSQKKLEHPNIIFIMSDDHAYQAISAYGGELAKQAPTPNIDVIAGEGMRFNRCLVTNSISGPSRACILTGKYSHMNGFIANEATPFDSSQQTFPKLLRQAGYETAIIGKWHLDSQPAGFDNWDILIRQGNYYNPDFISEEGVHREKGYVTEIITRKCIDWLKNRKDKDKPFMLMMHHKAPHRNWMPGPNELGLFSNTHFPEPPTLFDDYSGRGQAEHLQDMTIAKTMELGEDLKIWKDTTERNKSAEYMRMDRLQRNVLNAAFDTVISAFFTADPEGDDLLRWKYQHYLRDYLRCIAAVDKSVGEILHYLKESGLDKNTVVIYTSDQGFYLGEHGWFDKRFMFEESYRTPLLIKWPGEVEPGSVNNDMVSNLDFAETLLDIAGVKIPKDMQGESMVPVLEGKTPVGWRTEHYYHYYGYPDYHSVRRHYGISTRRYKLIHYYYDIDEWELFDLQNDPLELKNVYTDPLYGPVKKDLHHRLDLLMKKYHDSDSLAGTMLPKHRVPDV